MQPPPPTASSLAGPEMAGEVLLDEILGPLPFRRKAVEELRAADEESTATAPGASEVEQRIIDPVDFFLGGMRGFNMPRIVEPRPDESAADAVLDAFLNSPATATTPLAQTAPPAGSNPASETVRRPSQGAGPSPFSGLASPARKPRAGRPRTDEDDWIDAAVAASQEGQVTSSPDAGGLAAPGAPAPARSAVGFTPETSKQLETLESALGNEKPEQSVKQLEVLISQQITPNIAPEVSLDDLDVLALIDDFDGKFGKKGASS